MEEENTLISRRDEEDWRDKVEDFKNRCAAYSIKIVASRFGCSEFDWETIQGIIDKKKLKSKVIMCGESPEYTLVYVGVVANNRWLYTIDGRTIGKKGEKWQWENLVL